MFGGGYVFLLAAVIPFFSWQQREEGRNLVAMMITGAFLMMWLATGTVPIVWDMTTIYVLCFALWMIASIFWSHSRQSSQDLFFMLCGLVVFLSARTIPFEVLLPILFVPGVVFSAATLIYHKSDKPKRKWFIFGNPNHIGAFLLIPLFAGMWLTFNMSWFLLPLVVLIATAIGLSRCRGAQIGVIVGLLYVACIEQPYMLSTIPMMLIFVYLVARSRGKSFYESTSGRISLIVAALYLIVKAPLSGYGLRTFRREYPSIIPKLLNSKLLKHFYARGTTVTASTSHRIHNDHLEIIFELGIIGYILLVSIFSSLLWTENILLSGALIAFAVHGFFFFPLREAHTAFPFWALAGGLAGTTLPLVTITPVIAIVLALIVGRIMYWVFIKLLALSYYDKSVKIAVLPNAETEIDKKALSHKQTYINLAIQCDPYNNLYLTDGYYYNVFDKPELAFQFASRCMENYDGGKVRWGVCDQYARALLRFGGMNIAESAVKYALHICPDFQQSQELLVQIKEMQSQMEKPK